MEYAEILQPKFAYATIGYGIVEPEYITGMQQSLNPFPSPADLWDRLRSAGVLADDKLAEDLLPPFSREQRNPNGASRRSDTSKRSPSIGRRRPCRKACPGSSSPWLPGLARPVWPSRLCGRYGRLNSSGGSSALWTEPPGRPALAHVSQPDTSSFRLAEP